jgi:hypothetical protein
MNNLVWKIQAGLGSVYNIFIYLLNTCIRNCFNHIHDLVVCVCVYSKSTSLSETAVLLETVPITSVAELEGFVACLFTWFVKLSNFSTINLHTTLCLSASWILHWVQLLIDRHLKELKH